jgi:hypothetical protein
MRSSRTCKNCGTRVMEGKPVKRITFDENRQNVVIEREG